MKPLYEDHLVQLTEQELKIHHYYFPFGSKTVPLSEIKEIEIYPPTLLSGKWRIWGTRSLDIWFALDWYRPKREAILVAHLRTQRIKAGFTVENYAQFIRLIAGRVPLRHIKPEKTEISLSIN